VDRDGTVYQILEETAIGRHVIGLNHLSIGIENVGDRHNYPLTQDQIDSNVALIRHLSARHEITHVIGHYEYREMEGHPYFQEQRDRFRTIRGDPGEDFMRGVREEIRDLGLQGAPPFPRD
jgi:N-acetyl-anhydromuramyl-L-alanine amidase AmpD